MKRPPRQSRSSLRESLERPATGLLTFAAYIVIQVVIQVFD